MKVYKALIGSGGFEQLGQIMKGNLPIATTDENELAEWFKGIGTGISVEVEIVEMTEQEYKNLIGG